MSLQKRYSLYTENQYRIHFSFRLNMKFLDEIIDILDRSIHDEAERSITEWNIIKDGYDWEVDIIRSEIQCLHNWLEKYQKELISSSSISSLKIKFTSNVWYFIELWHSHTSKIWEDFIFLQTLTGSSRYTTEELKNFEKNINRLYHKLYDLEYSIFSKLRNDILSYFNNIKWLSDNIAYIDLYSNGAFISADQTYQTPVLSEKYTFEIQWWKHPIIAHKHLNFVSNDLKLDKSEFIHVITWPNMWWKSTYLRQNALLALMAHMGYDIPCEYAHIGLIDRIFSRVWSWDNLYLGQSTFMVEMQEISFILHHASKRSFIIIDEIWRGTSTYDGMSLAWSILEYILQTLQSKTLFSTHYHEIIEYTERIKGASNYSMSVWGKWEGIVFLRKIVPGGIKKSYWVEVAKLAWIPKEIIQNAKYMIHDLQSGNNPQQLSMSNENILWNKYYNNLQQENKCQDIINLFNDLDIDRISPLEWLQKLSEIQKEIRKL